MSQQNMTGVFTVPCAATANSSLGIGAYLRVKADATYGLALAGAGDVDLGPLATSFIAAGLGSAKYASVCGSNSSPVKYVANGIIAQFAAVYAAASGKVASTGTLLKGYALDAAAADGDVIRVVRDWNEATNAAAASTGTTATSFTVGSGNTGPSLAVSVATSTGQYTETLQVPTLGAAAVVTLPAVTGTLATLGGTETLTAKTLTAPAINLGKVSVNATPVTATNSGAAIGAQDVVTIAGVTGQTAYKVKLLAGVAGQRITLIETAGFACQLIPATGGTINGLAANAAVVLGASKVYVLICTASDTWFAMEAAVATAA